MNRPRTLLADDHTLMLEGLRRLLQGEVDVVGTVEDGRALLEAAARLQPELILVDISMPLLNGIDATRQLRALAPGSRVIILTMHADPTYAIEAFKAGAAAYLVKRSAASELVQAIRSVVAGRRYVGRGLPASVPAPDAGSERPGRLTARQREVLQLVAEGRSGKEIAALLGISVKTVEFHRARITEQLGLRSTAELTRYAVAHGLVTAGTAPGNIPSSPRGDT